MLFQILPILVPNYFVDRAYRNGKPFRYYFAGRFLSMKQSNFPNLLFGELGSRIQCSLSSWASNVQSSFFGSVFHVIVLRTSKKMARITARWIIAMVQNVLQRPNTIGQEESYAMCEAAKPSFHELPITMMIFSPKPEPAFVRAYNINKFPKFSGILRRKSGGDRIRQSHVGLLNRLTNFRPVQWTQSLFGPNLILA